METAALVLLIVVSTTLSIFLIVTIIALVYFIGILRQVRRITHKAENVADSVESAAEMFERSATPLAVLKIVGDIVDKVTKIKRRKG